MPISVWEEMTGALEFYNYRGRCIYCDMVQQELAVEKRIVLDSTHFTAFCPFASRFPFETWILPKTHSSHFENIPKPGVDDLGQVLHQVLNKLELALDSPAYNYIIHTAPFDHGELPHYHWHIEVIPRLTKVAGFEWGSGFYINPVPPENAAGFLREVEVAGADPKPGVIERGRGDRRKLSPVEFVGVGQPSIVLRPCFARPRTAVAQCPRVENVAGSLDSRTCTTTSPWAISTASSRRPIAPAIARSWTCSRNIPRFPSPCTRPGRSWNGWSSEHPEYIARAAGPGRGRPGRDPGRRVLRADPDHDPIPGPRGPDPGVLELS